MQRYVDVPVPPRIRSVVLGWALHPGCPVRRRRSYRVYPVSRSRPTPPGRSLELTFERGDRCGLRDRQPCVSGSVERAEPGLGGPGAGAAAGAGSGAGSGTGPLTSRQVCDAGPVAAAPGDAPTRTAPVPSRATRARGQHHRRPSSPPSVGPWTWVAEGRGRRARPGRSGSEELVRPRVPVRPALPRVITAATRHPAPRCP